LFFPRGDGGMSTMSFVGKKMKRVKGKKWEMRKNGRMRIETGKIEVKWDKMNGRGGERKMK
jgi:hypothetical protein